MSQMGFKRPPYDGSTIGFERPQIFHSFRCQDYLVRHLSYNLAHGIERDHWLRHRRQGHGVVAGRDEMRAFIERTQLPFLRSPMGKGVVPDDHPLSVTAARAFALQNAGAVFLMGARYNWTFISASRHDMPRNEAAPNGAALHFTPER